MPRSKRPIVIMVVWDAVRTAWDISDEVSQGAPLWVHAGLRKQVSSCVLLPSGSMNSACGSGSGILHPVLSATGRPVAILLLASCVGLPKSLPD